MNKQPASVTDLPAQLPNESDAAFERRVIAFLSGEDVRTKTDLRDWTGSLPFHLNREPKP